MDTLERELAGGVVELLRERAHVALSDSRADALRDELTDTLSVCLAGVIDAISASGLSRSKRSNTQQVAMDQIANQLADRVLASHHVDDVFASEQVIRRDTRRLLQRLLVAFVREQRDGGPLDREQTVVVPLLELGYVVAEVSKRLDAGLLRDALERAAATLRGTLLTLSGDNVATFELPGRAETLRLALEEAVTQELVALIESELVELPQMEQVLELADVDCLAPEFELAIERSLIRTRAEFDCMAQCVCVDEHTVIATLTPLSAHAAADSSALFGIFISTLEQELTSPTRTFAVADDKPAAELPDSSRRPSSRPASSRKRKGQTQAPPHSQPRNRRGSVQATSSSTRNMRAAAKRKRAK